MFLLLVILSYFHHDAKATSSPVSLRSSRTETTDPVLDESPLVAQQFSKDPYQGFDKRAFVKSGKFKLIDVQISKNNDVVMGNFCEFEFDQRYVDPSMAPRYSDYYGESINCQEHAVAFPLHEVAQECREFDKVNTGKIYNTNPSAFILHQPKSGSTLLSNMLTVARPDTFVVSEPAALRDILKCENCDRELQIQALEDTMYFLGRSRIPLGDMYIKISSQYTIGLSLIRETFPETKWIYLTRSPEIVLQKLMNSKNDRRICGGKRFKPTKAMKRYLSILGKNAKSLIVDEKGCAADLGTTMSIVKKELRQKNSRGKIVDYNELLDLVSIKELFSFLQVSSSNWKKIEEQRRKTANTGKGNQWRAESSMYITLQVSDAISEFGLNV